MARRSHLRSPGSAVRVQRIERDINGRRYLIEVGRVTLDMWRAQLIGLHGGPTALMPFYGPTPDEAARLLGDWLTRAHRNNSTSV